MSQGAGKNEVVPVPSLAGDGPKSSIADDSFGLEQIAKATASLLADRIVADGYTIGIEGEWGSGKTSLTNFIVEELKKRSTLTLKIMRFEPWLVGKRSALLNDLFRGLRAKIAEFRDDPLLKDKLTDEDKKLIGRLGESLERYQLLLEAAGKGASVTATVDPTLHSGAVAAILQGLSWLAKQVAGWSKPKIRTLEELRETIKGDLHALTKLSPNTRFIVIIDDVDRLEPAESIEILRLVRAVVDFPLVTYLVCYDRPHLAEQIKKVVGVGTGYDYLKKIFQSIITLPPQEAFALRRYCRKLLAERFREEFLADATTDPGQAEREGFFFDHWCGRLITTPRSAVRLAEAVTLGWPELKGKADFIDYVWLQLIKLERHDLYEWVRGYVVNVGAYRDGGRPGDDEPAQFAERLRNILSDAGWSLKRDQAGIHYLLPGVDKYIDEKKPRVLELDGRELSKYEAERRLGSPSHWRLYFALDEPSYALEDDILGSFRAAAAARDVQRGVDIIRALIARPHAHKAYFLGVFLERLFDMREGLSSAEQIGLALIFGEVMDEAPAPTGLLGEIMDAWRRAETLMLPAAAPEFAPICVSGSALNWLTDLIRSQGFAYGRPESRSSTRGEPWLDPDQFETSLNIILGRIYALPMLELLLKPRPLTLLYCWLQLGDPDSLHSRVMSFVGRDDNLLTFLEGLRSWAAHSGRGVFHSLQSLNVQHFLDVPATADRVRALSTDAADFEIRNRAVRLLDVWDWDRGR